MRPLFVSGLFAIAVASPTFAQIVPATDGLGTQVTIDGAQIDITGGRTSSDDTNLFHSFESFNLGTGEAANFQVLPNIENILGRVVGGSGSLVDGLLGVTGGDANLYLIDPAGIVFGENARLDVAGDFVATTATSVGFGDRWLDVMGNNIWSELVGNPTGFGFAGTGAIVNLGELTVDSGQNIGLFGDAVINAGSLSAPGGGVAIVASEAGDRIRLGIPGNVLSLEVDREALHADPTALALPEVMSGEVESAGAIVRDADGSIRLGASPVSVEPLVGDALVSGAIDVASTDGVGGTALVLGERVGMLAGAIDASGRDGGGAVNIGGNFQGVGALPNSELTVVDGESAIVVDGVVLGDGGRAIVWADGSTRFSGEVLARGGSEGGNGGFVEVSGKRFLDFVGEVDTSAANGEFGTLLLDPAVIRVVDDAVAETSDLTTVDEFGDADIGGDRETLVAASAINNAMTDVELRADERIVIESDLFLLEPGVGFHAYSNGGVIILSDIETDGGDIELHGNRDLIDGGFLRIENSTIRSNGGNISMIGHGSSEQSSGIYIKEVSDIIADGGNISIIGYGGNEISANDGIFIERVDTRSTAPITQLQIETNGQGNINIHGIAGRSNESASSEPGNVSNLGIRVDFVGDRVVIKSENGDISILGEAEYQRDLSNVYNSGASLTNTRVESFGAGNITLRGVGDYFGLSFGFVSTNDGDINITGHSLGARSPRTMMFWGYNTIESESGNININSIGCSSDCSPRTGSNGSIDMGQGAIIETGYGDINIQLSEGVVPRFLINDSDIERDSSIRIHESGNLTISTDNDSFAGRIYDVFLRRINIFLEDGNLEIRGFRPRITQGDIRVPNGYIQIGANVALESTSLFTNGHEISLGRGSVVSSGEGYSIESNGGDIFLEGSVIRIDGSVLSQSTNGEAGNINILGGAVDIAGSISARSDDGDAGNIVVLGNNRVTLGNVDASSSQNAGDISITSRAPSICFSRPDECSPEINGFIDTTAGIINAGGGINGGQVDIFGGGNIDTGTIILFNPGFRGDSGDIGILSETGTIRTISGSLITASALGEGGNVTLSSGRNIEVALIDARSFSSTHSGGEISLNSVSSRFRESNDLILQSNLITNRSNIVLQGELLFSSQTGVESLEFGDIDIDGSIDGTESLTLNAGTGNIEISGEIGQNTPLRDLTLIGNLTDPSGDPLLIQVQNFIQADSFTTQNDLTLQAGGDITIDDINTPGDVSIFSIDGDITAGRIDTGNDLADAGNIDLQAQNVTIASANLQSLNDIGGNLNIDARNGNVRITDSFTDLNGNQASISTLGGLESGTVYIFHGGGGIVPFIVGDAARNGSAAAITRGTAAAESIAFSAYPNRHTQDADRLILDTIPAPPPPAPEEPATTPDPSETTPETPTEPGEPETTSEETTSSTPSASPFDDLLDRAPSGTDPSADTSTDDASPTDTSTSTTTGEVPETESTAAPEETPTAEPDTTPPADPTSGLDTSTDPAIPDPSTSETPGGTIDPSDPDSGSDPTESSDPVTPIDPAAEDDGLIETELDLTNPIDRLIALIGETIGAETKVAIDPDTGATVASWLVEETDGLGGSDSTLITQVIPNLEPDVTVSEPVEVAATPPAVSTPDPEPIADPAPVAAAPAAAPRTATPTPVVTPAPAATPAPSSTPATPTQQDNAPVEETETPTEVTLPNLNPTIPELLTLGDGDALVEELESDFEAEFEEAADEDLNEDGDRRLTAAQIRETLQELETQTGRRGAIVYASTFCTETRGQATYDGANCLDGSEHVALALVTPGEATIVRTVQLDRQLARIVSEFQGQLTDPRQIRHHTYKQGAQKLYDILVRPIADELDSFDLDLLVYAVDAGLRQIPLAALHDGDRFLVERYSIGSIPSMGLTDTRYQRLRDSSVLAMGADEFPVTNNSALPAVPFELDAIVAESPDTAKADSTEPDAGIWPGQEFLNEDFTFANLIGQRNRAPYEIVHLATHAHFESGNPYIDLWDERKSLDEFREAEWYAPPTVELLVLSACDTARGDPEAELGFAGLAVRSGVKSVLASLWKISDLGTLSVMASFYGELGDAPLKAEAMRAAQLAMLRGEVEFAGDAIVMGDRRVPLPPEYHNTTADLSHPYYWAAFSMVGSPW